MPNRDLLLMASILALLRGEVTVRGVAERFGVTEAQVARWRDIFEIAGMLALSSFLSGKSAGPGAQRRPGEMAPGSEQTEKPFDEPSTPPPHHWTTPWFQPNNPFDEPSTPKPRSRGEARSQAKTKKGNKRTKSKRKR